MHTNRPHLALPLLLPLIGVLAGPASAQGPAPADDAAFVLRPARVFDGTGDAAHEGWVVVVRGERIEAAGPAADVAVPAGARVVDLPGATVLPGLIDAHTHILLHDYREADWEDQVLREPLALRVCRATNHLKLALQSGFTTYRDLGTEGAGYADIGLRDAVAQGIVPGPRLLVATRAIVASRTYAPSGFAPEVDVPQGAEEADGETLRRVVRDQIGRGADVIKVYADNARGATFSEAEIRLAVETAASLGRPVAAHATTREGMRRAAMAGVRSIEHGEGGDAEVFRLMAERKVAFCPTLAVFEAALGLRPAASPRGRAAAEARVARSRVAFRLAREAGVAIANGSDIGAFAHGEGARELELMVDAGMTPAEALRAATSVAAGVVGLGDRVGAIRPGMAADLIAVEGDPARDIRALRSVRFVARGGVIHRGP